MSTPFQAQMEADLAGIYSGEDGHSEAVVYTDSHGSYSLQAIYDERYQKVDPNTGSVIMSTAPKLRVTLTAMRDEPKPTDRITVRGAVYKVRSYEPGAPGEADLLLMVA